MALVCAGTVKAEKPSSEEAPKTKAKAKQEDSGINARNKNASTSPTKKSSVSTKTNSTRQDATAKVTQLEHRVNQLRKDLEAARTKTENTSEKESPAPLPDGSPIPKAVLVATPDEARNGLPADAKADASPASSVDHQASTPPGDRTAAVIRRTPHAVAVSSAPSSCPVAEKANTPGFVISPFPPRKLIDATGMSAGAVVKDPETGAIFRLPKDLVEVQVIVDTP
jgi:hypothetical protein